MESILEILKLDRIPIGSKYSQMSFTETLKTIDSKKSSDIVIEAACGTEATLISLFESRNVPDSLKAAYQASFTRSDSSLYKHYLSILNKGDSSITGFISNIKGKVFELELTDKLEEFYPEYDFSIATDPTNPIWDIKGINVDDGTEFLIQAKMGATQYAGDTIERMQENPDVFFAVSNEIHDKIIDSIPELSDQFIDVDFSNFDFSNEVKANLDLLADNMGIDVPDSLVDALPYITEIILGIKLILDLIQVQRDFKSIPATEKAKISAVKVIVLLSRFGISTTLTFLGGAAGTAIAPSLGPAAPAGPIAGGILGAVTASQLNKYLKPHIMEFVLNLSGLNENDLFYFRNKLHIDNLALSFANTKI